VSQNQRKNEVVQVFGEQKKNGNKNENRAEVQYLQPNVEQKNLVMKEEAMNHTVHGYKKLTADSECRAKYVTPNMARMAPWAASGIFHNRA
jgi:hypothetical protein